MTAAYFTLWHREGHQWLRYSPADYPTRKAAGIDAELAVELGEDRMAITEDSRYPTDADEVR